MRLWAKDAPSPLNLKSQSMPFFNFRRGQSGTASPPPESMDVIRRRAKHRLIGSAVLVLAGVVGFPLLFDTQPRPIAVDIPIEIPNKNAVKAVQSPVTPAKPAKPAKPDAATPPAKASVVTPQSSLTPQEEIVAAKAVTPNPVVPKLPPVAQAANAPIAPKKEAKAEVAQVAKSPESKPAAKPEPRPEPKPDLKPEPKPEQKTEPKPATKPDDGERAKALLNGKAMDPPIAAAADSEVRFIVQVGAFADEAKAVEVRQKVERAGLKTYTHVANTPAGKRTRVRVGPFATKADADKAASKIKTLDLPAAILTL